LASRRRAPASREYLPLANPKAPESKKKFIFQYSIYGTKATDEENDPLMPDEFQKFIHAASTTVARNGPHWNSINLRDGEDFREVRKESQFYSNKLYCRLKIQDVA